MNPPHHHHPHEHHHAAVQEAPRWHGLLTAGVAPRLAGAVLLLVVLWLGVAWAMT
jgi:hypothetical protein